MDLSQLSTEDLQALKAGDLTKVSTAGLQALKGQSAAPATSTPAAPAGGILHTLAGVGETVGAGLANIPGAAVNSAANLVSNATGHGDLSKPIIPAVQPGQAARDLATNVKGLLPGTPNGLEVSDDELRANDPTGKVPIEQLRAQFQAERNKPLAQTLEEGPTGANVVGHALQAGQDVANVAAGGALAKGAVTGAGALLDNTLAKGTQDAAGTLGYRGANSTTGKLMAGNSAGPALINHNATVGNLVVGNEAGLARGVTPSYETLAAARTAPSGVFDRVAAAVPNGPLDAEAQAAVKNAGLPAGGRVSAGSPQAQAQIEQLRQQLLNPSTEPTGQTWVNELRGLRQEGFTNAASDDVSNQQLGKAQLDMANAVEGHLGRAIPQGSDVSLQQFQDARKALAKNYTAQSALRGDTFDLKAIARMQRADPGLLDGDMKTTADFANANQEVVGQPNSLLTPSFAKDVASLNPVSHPIGSAIQAVTGPLGRRILTGPKPTGAALSPRPDFSPGVPMTAPPGRAGIPPQQQSLGDLMQGPAPAPGLDLAPPPGTVIAPAQRDLGALPQGRPGVTARSAAAAKLKAGEHPRLGDLFP
jgi:hypothetical protein